MKHRNMQARSIFTQFNNLEDLYSLKHKKQDLNWSPEMEQPKFSEDTFHSPILMRVLYGEKLEYLE